MANTTRSSGKATVSTIYADNTSEAISEGDIRTGHDNLWDSSAIQTDNNTFTGSNDFTAGYISVPTPSSPSHAVNQAYVEALLSGFTPISNILGFVDFTASEPGSPTSGDRYINTVTGTSSGTAQSMTADYIYQWNGSTWTETIPSVGDFLTDESSGIPYIYKSTGWEIVSNSVSHNATTGLQGGTSGQYNHLTNTQLTNLLSKAASETVSGAWIFSSLLTVNAHIKYRIGLLSKSANYPIVEADGGKIIGVTAACTQTLPLSSTLSAGWNITVDNQISAGGTVTLAKNAGDSTGIMLHEGATADSPLLETKYTSVFIWWDGTNFHLRGRIT